MSKIKAVKICFDRIEGPIGTCGEKIFEGKNMWFEVNLHICISRESSPKPGCGASKCDFKVYFEDGEVYTGEFDLSQDIRYKEDLNEHILDHCWFHAGYWCPDHWPMNEYLNYIEQRPDIIQDYRNFLAKYDLSKGY